MFAKIIDGEVVAFPYNAADLKRDNPNTSFPEVITEELLESYNIYRVVQADPPEESPSPYLNWELEETPVLVDGVWTLNWRTFEITQEVIDRDNEFFAFNYRRKRNSELLECDWTQVPDAPLTDSQVAAWATYRQALRDITSHANWPRLTDDDWPTKPN